jgi:hypothetical protein
MTPADLRDEPNGESNRPVPSVSGLHNRRSFAP